MALLTGHLCQRAGVSCGACCGLYNRRDPGRDAAAETLDRHTAALHGVPRSTAAFRVAARRDAAGDDALFPMVKVCPLLGWLDPGHRRVGCLGHPRASGGADLRDAGAYDARLCESFRCPSHDALSEQEASLAAHACAGDPWLYGLVVTDAPFLRACVEGVSRLAGVRVVERHLERPDFARAFGRLLALKEELAPGSDGLFGAFRAGIDGEALDPASDDAAPGSGSPQASVLRCLGADLRSGNDPDVLEGAVRARLEACAATLS